MWLFIICCITMGTASSQQDKPIPGSYFITYPEDIERGMPFKINIDILNTTVPVLIHAEMQRFWSNYTDTFRIPMVMTQGYVTKGSTGTLTMKIPQDLPDGRFYLHIRGSEGLNFERDGYVSLSSSSISIMVQTDKVIYKPGQLVRFRAFAIYPNLQLYYGQFDITLTDPNQNAMKHWTGLQSSTGVVEGQFQLADKTVFGDWKLLVEAEDETDKNTKVFTVAQYQLPRFKVTVDLPSFGLTTDTMLSGTVKSEYTFGQPVKGMVELHAHIDSSYSDYCGRPPKYVELAFPIDGDTKFDLPLADIRRLTSDLDNTAVVITAIVKEGLTGVRLNGSSKITFYKHPYTIEVMDSTPSVFSPKLPYTAFIKVSQQDGLPITDMTSPMRMNTCIRYKIVQDDQSMYGCSSFTGTRGLTPKNYTIPASGIIPIDMDIPENTTEVHYKDVYAEQRIRMKESISQNYIQLRLLDNLLKIGQDARFSVQCTEDIPYVTYEVISRGMMIHTGQVTVNTKNPVTFTIPITTMMSPVSHILVYYVRSTTEIVSDSQSIKVDEIFDNKVSIAFSRNESEPHKDIGLVVTADPNSTVNLLAVDQSVLLLKTGNDITTDQVFDSLKDYKTGTTNGDFSPEVLAITSSAESTTDVFSRAGLRVITDAWYYDHEHPPGYFSVSGPTPYPIGYIPYPGATPYAGPIPYPIGYTPSPGATPYVGGGGTPYPIGFVPYPGATPYPGALGQQALKEVSAVRHEFPDTWLWENYTIGADGKVIVNTTVPDTITSWVASAFAVNSATGLGIAPSTTKLKTFKSFFVSLSMPTSVLRGEQVIIQASVFNYLPSDVDVVVSLPTSSNYINIVVDNTGKTSQESKDQIQHVTVNSNKQGTVYFPIIPSSLGAIDIEVSARSTLAADGVRRQLYVEAEGIPKEYNIPTFIELTPGGADFNKRMSLSLPSEVVTGSERAKVKVTGDLIGASLDSLENLLSMPTGCGEQMMMSFAPDVYVADYLTTTRQMTPALEAKITDFLELGFQRELTYQRSDGSFSAFGNRDESGSMWLTAFVTQTFHQARPYIFVDNSTLTRALRWMADRQNLDGSFNEPGLVINRQIKKSGPSLTAMVLLAFLENSEMSGYGIPDYMYGNATMKAAGYLDLASAGLTDTFSLAVVSYALAKMSSVMEDVPFNKLNSAAHVKGNMKYWSEPVVNSPKYFTKWSPPNVRAQPMDIQTTAYALLATSARGDLKGGLPIVNWLTAQRNPHGGFSSTQDTMVALRALTDFAQLTHTSGFHVELDIQTGSTNQHISVTDRNALVLQSRDFSPFPSEVTFTATGRGVAYAEVDVFFNVEAEIGEPAFDISAILLDDTINNFRLMTCTKWLKTGSTGMAVMEISIPSGFEPDMSSVGNVAGIKSTERRGRNVVVYFDEIGKTSICFDLLSTRTGMVTNNQQSYITVYDYYQPDNQASIFYQTRSLKRITMCDVCNKCCPQTP